MRVAIWLWIIGSATSLLTDRILAISAEQERSDYWGSYLPCVSVEFYINNTAIRKNWRYVGRVDLTCHLVRFCNAYLFMPLWDTHYSTRNVLTTVFLLHLLRPWTRSHLDCYLWLIIPKCFERLSRTEGQRRPRLDKRNSRSKRFHGPWFHSINSSCAREVRVGIFDGKVVDST